MELALSLRQELAKSSVKKYTAMQTVVGSDDRARGLIQFYGANRTGRYAGRLIQVQNLPQNHLPDLDTARALVRSGNTDAVEMLYDSVPLVLSELIRTAFVPKPGCHFMWQTSPPSRRESSHGSLGNIGGRRFLQRAATFTALPLRRCSMSP